MFGCISEANVLCMYLHLDGKHCETEFSILYQGVFSRRSTAVILLYSLVTNDK